MGRWNFQWFKKVLLLSAEHDCLAMEWKYSYNRHNRYFSFLYLFFFFSIHFSLCFFCIHGKYSLFSFLFLELLRVIHMLCNRGKLDFSFLSFVVIKLSLEIDGLGTVWGDDFQWILRFFLMIVLKKWRCPSKKYFGKFQGSLQQIGVKMAKTFNALRGEVLHKLLNYIFLHSKLCTFFLIYHKINVEKYAKIDISSCDLIGEPRENLYCSVCTHLVTVKSLFYHLH